MTNTIRFGMVLWPWKNDRQSGDQPAKRDDQQYIAKRALDRLSEQPPTDQFGGPRFSTPTKITNNPLETRNVENYQKIQKLLKQMPPEQYGKYCDWMTRANPDVIDKQRIVERLNYLEHRVSNSKFDHLFKKLDDQD